MAKASDLQVAHGLGLICTTPRIAPPQCPVCHDTTKKGGFKTLGLAYEAHILNTHATKAALHPDCVSKQATIKDQPPRWVLDWEVVRHGRPGDPLYFCVTCGLYAPDVQIGVHD